MSYASIFLQSEKWDVQSPKAYQKKKDNVESNGWKK